MVVAKKVESKIAECFLCDTEAFKLSTSILAGSVRTGKNSHAQYLWVQAFVTVQGQPYWFTHLRIELEGWFRVLDANHGVIKLKITNVNILPFLTITTIKLPCNVAFQRCEAWWREQQRCETLWRHAHVNLGD